MATLAAVARALYYPTNLRIVAGCLPYLKLPAQATIIRVLDPCAGKGSAAYYCPGYWLTGQKGSTGYLLLIVRYRANRLETVWNYTG